MNSNDFYRIINLNRSIMDMENYFVKRISSLEQQLSDIKNIVDSNFDTSIKIEDIKNIFDTYFSFFEH